MPIASSLLDKPRLVGKLNKSIYTVNDLLKLLDYELNIN